MHLLYVPSELMNEEICKLAIQQNYDALKYIKDIMIKEKIRNLL